MRKYKQDEEMKLIKQWYSIKKLGGKLKDWLDVDLLIKYCPRFFCPDDLVSIKDGEDGRKKITTLEYCLECQGYNEEEINDIINNMSPIFKENKPVGIII